MSEAVNQVISRPVGDLKRKKGGVSKKPKRGGNGPKQRPSFCGKEKERKGKRNAMTEKLFPHKKKKNERGGIPSPFGEELLSKKKEKGRNLREKRRASRPKPGGGGKKGFRLLPEWGKQDEVESWTLSLEEEGEKTAPWKPASSENPEGNGGNRLAFK